MPQKTRITASTQALACAPAMAPASAQVPASAQTPAQAPASDLDPAMDHVQDRGVAPRRHGRFFATSRDRRQNTNGNEDMGGNAFAGLRRRLRWG